MSRHRDVRNLEPDDYDDDSYGSSYGSSYVDETSLSTSMENYMYRRRDSGGAAGSTGHTPKMGHFVLGRSDSVPSVPEDDEDKDDDDPNTPRLRERSDSETSSGSNTYDDLDERSQARLAECLEVVLDIVGDTMPEHVIKEAIVRCDFNSEVAVNTLLNNPVGHRGAGSKGPSAKNSPRGAAATSTSSDDPVAMPPPLSSDPRPSTSTAAGPSTSSAASTSKLPQVMNYKDIPTIRTTASGGGGKKPKIIEVGGPAPSSASSSANHLTAKPDGAAAADGGDPSRSRSQSPVISTKDSAASPMSSEPPSGRDTPVHIPPSASSSSLLSTPKATPMRKAKVDVAVEYARERGGAGAKQLLNMVVVGHVDSGKSTLMGHLLYRLGSVSSRAMHKYEQESRKLGKQSFAYAWVLDETTEERERGITMDVGQSRFETPSRSVVLLDAPGHKDFIPNMISGAYQADVAILVVNAARGEFEAGFDAGGQTREHALLVRSLGVSQLAVAVNKLDTVEWSQDRFEEISAKLRQFLRQVGFREQDTVFVPCSGFTGDNLAEPSPHLASWYTGGTLLDAIDGFKPPERLVDRPFRMSVSDVYKPQSAGFCVSGRVESGFVQKEDKVLIAPLSEVATVKGVMVDDGASSASSGGGAAGQCAFAGDTVSLVLSGPDQATVSPGMVACDPTQPIASVRRFRARVVVFNADVPITKGFPCVMHHLGVQSQATVKKLVAVVNKSSGEVVKSRPRCLTKNCNAVVEVGLDSPACMELYSTVKELGRFMLRSGGKTIAAGLVTDLL